jgi:ATP-dependent helicase HrpB
VKLPSHDPLIYQTWICAAQLDSGKGEGRIYLAAPIMADDLTAVAKEHVSITWDAVGGRLAGATERRIGNVILNTRPLATIADEEAIPVICRHVQNAGLSVLEWGEAEVDIQSRILSLRTWRPDDGWPDVTTSGLLETVGEWLSPYLNGVRRESELKKLDKVAILRGLLSWELQKKLDDLAPSKVEVPTGSMIRLRYFDDGALPVLEVRLQELFGLADTPTVNDGRVNVILHLLSPGYKPVQVTQDLRSFWETTYHEVRKELRRRYPKHSWPEDPWTAEPVRGAKRRKPG